MQKKALVLGGGGFIGHHLVNSLKNEGLNVTAVDIKEPSYEKSNADIFIKGNLSEQEVCSKVFDNKYFDEVYQLAADMGGAGYIFTGENDANVMYNSASINLNTLKSCLKNNIKNIFIHQVLVFTLNIIN